MASSSSHGLVLMIDKQPSISADGLLISSLSSPGWNNFLVCNDSVNGLIFSVNQHGDVLTRGTIVFSVLPINAANDAAAAAVRA